MLCVMCRATAAAGPGFNLRGSRQIDCREREMDCADHPLPSEKGRVESQRLKWKERDFNSHLPTPVSSLLRLKLLWGRGGLLSFIPLLCLEDTDETSFSKPWSLRASCLNTFPLYLPWAVTLCVLGGYLFLLCAVLSGAIWRLFLNGQEQVFALCIPRFLVITKKETDGHPLWF